MQELAALVLVVPNSQLRVQAEAVAVAALTGIKEIEDKPAEA
jgi:hypothetical protein